MESDEELKPFQENNVSYSRQNGIKNINSLGKFLALYLFPVHWKHWSFNWVFKANFLG